MIKGIGIDAVSICEVKRFIENFGDTYINRTFTKKEVAVSRLSPQPAEYLATRFAAKEAVFKATAHFTKNKGFDLRIIETLNEADGYPVVQMKGELPDLLKEADITAVHISLTTEKDLALAYVVAESS